MIVRPAKTQISLGIRPVWSESSLCAQWVAKDPSFRHADSEDSDQTGRMPTLIWVFAERTCHFVGFVTRRPIFLYIMDIITWNSVALKVICVHAIIFVNIMFPLKIDRIIFFILQIIWKRHLLAIEHPTFENSRLGLIESVLERYWQMRHPPRRLAPGWALLCSQINY